jgi:hypothetical protein
MGTSHDAQREMEQRALRNVRGLVDKVEGQDTADGRAQRRMLRNFAIGAVIAVIAFVGLFSYLSGKDRGRAITIEQKR